MRKKFLAIVAVMVAAAVFAAMAGAAEVYILSKGETLSDVAVACGQPSSAWIAIWAANPWLKMKKVKGRPVPIIHPGQPIVLPEGWKVATEEAGFAALWSDFCDMAKEYPIPCAILFFLFVAVATAKEALRDRSVRKRTNIAESAVARPTGSTILPDGRVI